MRRQALWFREPGRVEVVDEVMEGPVAGELLARTRVSAISAGTELLAFRGELPAELAVDETLGALRGQTFTYPFRYGYAQVADVVEVGAGVDRAWVGQRIFAFAAHASAFVLPASDAILVPEGVAPERAALLAHMETAVNLILDGQPLLGENVVVLGLGTIGALTAALAARFPLATLAIADRSAPRLAVGRRLCGARCLALEPSREALGDALGGRGADLVFEVSGSLAALNLAIAVAGHEGRVVVGSWYGNKRGEVELGGAFHRRRLRLVSSQVSHIGSALSARWDRGRRLESAWTALRELDVSSLVTHRIPLGEAGEAYARLARGADDVGQILFTHEGAIG